ncbi:flagellar biosynthetic protein FliO [Microbacterium sp. CBA3102]|uniref:flagellar biosynthetic protein FliO n=1 Tax=Microbacterium sp. CBA3102 TaxID=2603598 RepID=UPI002AD5118A|nr:flagellar biosynthetic protein FliO [Microbacterium sp. CBA3102]
MTLDDLLLALRVALSLAAVLGLLWFLQRRVSRTAARRRDGEVITVLGRQGVGPKAQIVVVQTEDARYVLGVTEHGVNVVDRLPVKPAALPDDPATPVWSAATSEAASDAAEFDRILAATARTEDTTSAVAAQVPQRRVRHRNDPLRGSILSPETWRQTAEAIRRTR